MGQLICEDDAFPFKEHVMEYLDWLKQTKAILQAPPKADTVSSKR